MRLTIEGWIPEPGVSSLRLLDVMPYGVAVLAPDSRVAWVNRAWREFSLLGGGDLDAAVGSSYLDVCAAAAGAGDHFAASAHALISACLDGSDVDEAPRTLDYPCGDGAGRRWYRMEVRPLKPGGHSGALVVHAPITDLVEAATARSDVRDPATGLAGRLLLCEFLRGSQARGQRRGTAVAVAAVRLAPDDGDLDALARVVAPALQSVLRGNDLVARPVADTLVVAVEDVRTGTLESTVQRLTGVAQRVAGDAARAPRVVVLPGDEAVEIVLDRLMVDLGP